MPKEQLRSGQTGELKTSYQRLGLLCSIMVIAVNGVIYELLIGGYSSYLLGDSITNFSITIGLFMSSMGIGSWATHKVQKKLLLRFIQVEILLALIGGPIVLILAMAHIYTSYYGLVMIASIVAIGFLIGFEIPIVTRLVHTSNNLREALADVLSFDYIGALFGAILFPMVLLPHLGFARTSFLLGLLASVIVGFNLVIFKNELEKEYKTLWATLWFVSFLLLLGFIFSTGWIEAARLRAL